jgi:hypothetical protein
MILFINNLNYYYVMLKSILIKNNVINVLNKPIFTFYRANDNNKSLLNKSLNDRITLM